MKPKKSLGQNFLKNEEIVEKIIRAADLKSDDLVLEIGPGKGILTEELANNAGKVIAIELDSVLSNLLSNKFSNRKNVEVMNQDILKTNLKDLFSTYNLQPVTYKVVANIPYYITSPIIRMFLEGGSAPSEMILMTQKEVAERIVAGPGKMSILAVSVQYYGQPELLFNVGKENFDPIPKVDSSVIRISNIKNKASEPERKKFFQIVRAGFCAKRKILANNLSNSLQLDKKEAEEKLGKIGIKINARAQELGVEDWKRLAVIF